MHKNNQFRPRNIALLVAAMCAAPTIVFAENKAEILETGTIEVVSTTPLPSVGTPVDEVPANVQAVSGKAIAEQRNLDVSEFIDANLGSVSISNTVANPYQADVSFRGFTASPLLGTPQGMSVFMDGVRVNEPFGDIVNWDLIPANAIASINLIPGSNPLFGLNTLGGALSVHTKSGSEFPGVSVTAYGGSWGRKALEFEGGGANADKSVDYFVAGNTFSEDGWRDHSPSIVNQLFGKAGWQDDKSDLDLSVMLANTDLNGTQALPRSMLGNREQAYSWPDSIGNNLAMASLKGSHFLSDDKLVAANVYYRHNRITGFNSNLNNEYTGPADPQAFNIATTTDQDGYGAALQLTLLGDLAGRKNQFTAGVSADLGRTDFSSDTQEAVISAERETVGSSAFSPTVRLKTRNDYYGLYATDTFSITERLHVTASGRYNLAKIHLSGTNFDAGTDLSGDHRYSRFNPALGVNFNPAKTLGFYGGYNEGMRAATPVELSCADPAVPCALPNAFASDPHLNAVVSRTWEGGARGQIMGNLHWNAAIYRTQNTNDIQFIADSISTGHFENVGKTRRRGLELGLSGKFERLSLAANYGYVDATFQSQFDVGSAANSSAGTQCDGTAADGIICVHKGDKIPGIPRHTLKLRLGYELTPAWTVGANVVTASGQFARGDENNQDVGGKVPGYTVVHLDTHYSLNDNWKLFAKINNLFDRDYATFGVLGANAFASGAFDPAVMAEDWQPEQFRSPAAPRAAWVGVSYEFGRPSGGAAKPDLD